MTTHDTDRKDEGLDPFETWFASMSRADQQTYLPHSYAMRKAWNEALRRVSSVGGEADLKYWIEKFREKAFDRFPTIKMLLLAAKVTPDTHADECICDVCLEGGIKKLIARLTPDTSGEGELREQVYAFAHEAISGVEKWEAGSPCPARIKEAIERLKEAALCSGPSVQPQANGGLVEAYEARAAVSYVPELPRIPVRSADYVAGRTAGFNVGLIAGKEIFSQIISGEFLAGRFEQKLIELGYMPSQIQDNKDLRAAFDFALSTPSVQEAEVAGEELRVVMALFDEASRLAQAYEEIPDDAPVAQQNHAARLRNDAYEKFDMALLQAGRKIIGEIAVMSRLRSPRQTEVNAKLLEEKGPWRARIQGNGVHIESDDFTHDVTLDVTGDFITIAHKLQYAERIADVLNAACHAAADTPSVQGNRIAEVASGDVPLSFAEARKEILDGWPDEEAATESASVQTNRQEG